MVNHDPAMIRTYFERREKDKYYTEPWVTEAFVTQPQLGFLLESTFVAWEPAAGRGDMVSVLENYFPRVLASDIAPDSMYVQKVDFLNGGIEQIDSPVDTIITNPPYTHAEKFARAAELMVETGTITTAALLLRSEFKHAKSRRDIFGDCPWYYGELVLTKRPRWDWWYDPEPGEKRCGPRHNFSWFIWSEKNIYLDPVQIFWYE